MSLFGEFRVPATAFAFNETLAANPEILIEIQRVVAADTEYLTPYFWVSGVSAHEFEAAAQHDESYTNLRKLDESESMVMYRAEWKDHVEALVYAYTRLGASILEAKGQSKEWVLRMRFDEHENLRDFSEYLTERDVSFALERLYEVVNPRTGGQYGLTRKQEDALVTAWEMGYFDLPRSASMVEVAAELGITAQALSDRLRRAQQTLIGETLRLTMGTAHSDDRPPI